MYWLIAESEILVVKWFARESLTSFEEVVEGKSDLSVDQVR